MYSRPHSAAILLASFILSQAKSVFIPRSGEHSYIPNFSESTVCMTRQCVIEASHILTNLDENVDPCDDFYRFACGGWMNRHEISEEEPAILTKVTMQKNLDRKLKGLLESKYESLDPPFVKMLKDVYNTCMDVDSIEKKGSEPLKRMLNRLGGWPVIEGNGWDESTFDWVDFLISLRKLGFNHEILLNMLVYCKEFSDTECETNKYIFLDWSYSIIPYGSNLTLGLSDDKIASYLKTIIKAAKLLGADEATAEKEMLEVMKFMIAFQKMKVIEIIGLDDRDEKPFSYLTVKELQEKVPQIPWLKYFNGLFSVEVYENDSVNVERVTKSLTKLADLLTSTDKRVIANYMVMRAVLESAKYLSEEWRNIHSEVKKLLFGIEKTAAIPRWKTCLYLPMFEMEIALSAYYVRHYFKDETKEEAIIMMKYIHKEFLKILEKNDWMDEKTKTKAEEKANAMETYIGYPKELLNDTFVMKMCENLTISADSHLENVMALHKVSVDKYLSRLRNTMNKEAKKFKFMLRVGAFYSPDYNVIGIPASILADAFFEKERPKYLNFGAIGSVMGHEITHGFDNKGRKFDKDGNKVNWWDKDADEHFNMKAQCIIDQYNNYTTDTGLKVNGEITQNENIADNGGMKEAYLAYQSWTKDHGIEPVLPALNYTQNQLFWLSAARVWCSKMDAEKIKDNLKWNPHSPARYRVIGPMSNLDEFSKDFKCSPDSPMNKKYKCKVW